MPLREDEQRFEDRRDAGRRVAAKLAQYVGVPDVLVLALPRGGVPVAYEVADGLAAPLDVFLVRKLGVRVMTKWRWARLPPAASEC